MTDALDKPAAAKTAADEVLYEVSDAIATASSSDEYDTTGATGPKTSSQ